MIFLQAQALDNRSNDPLVLDGVVVTASTPRASHLIDVTSRIRMRGYMDSSRDTIITRHGDQVAVEISTEDFDIAGRPAPLLATVPIADLEPDQIWETVVRIKADAELIGRHFNAEVLASDLTAWRLSPKASGGPLTRRCRQFLQWLRKRLTRLFDWLGARFP